MSASLRPPPLMTTHEFLAWPGDGVNRLHALIDGEPVAMWPPSLTHGAIAVELATQLANHLRAARPRCRVIFEPGVRPRAGGAINVRIPDLGVMCGPVRGHLMDEPVALIEILSPGNARETREAIRAYLSIPSVADILLVWSTERRAELLTREPGGAWPEDPARIGPDEDLALPGLGFRIPLSMVYPPGEADLSAG